MSKITARKRVFRFHGGIALLVLSLTIIADEAQPGEPTSKSQNSTMVGVPVNGFRPEISVMPWPDGHDWEIVIAYSSPSNIHRGSWLLITNAVGAKLHLWRADGHQIHSRKADV